jgi:hypothetical protein
MNLLMMTHALNHIAAYVLVGCIIYAVTSLVLFVLGIKKKLI